MGRTRGMVRMAEERIPRKVMIGVAERTRRRGRHKLRWIDGVVTKLEGGNEKPSWMAESYRGL